MQESPPGAPESALHPSKFNQLRHFLLATWPGRALLALAAVVFVWSGYVWNKQYRGTGWTHTFNLALWYRRNRGEDLYHSKDAMLVHGSRKFAEVALTFDDGPHPKSRPQILETLKRFGVHATFFDVGVNISRCAELERRTLADGHEVANHSEHHLYLPQLSETERHREINDADIEYFAVTNQHLKLLRPPGMRLNPAAQAEVRALGYVTVAYTTAAKDADASDPAPAEVIAERTLGRIENGSILLLHDYPSTAEALPVILGTLAKRGFRCVTISEMVDHLPEPVRTDARKQLASTP